MPFHLAISSTMFLGARVFLLLVTLVTALHPMAAHAVGSGDCPAIVNRLMDMKPLNEKSVTDLIGAMVQVVLVTRKEHARLNAPGLRSTMPLNWNGSDVFARYRAVGIKLPRC